MFRHRLLRALLLLALALPCLAQVVHVANYSGSDFEGWKRATVDGNGNMKRDPRGTLKRDPLQDAA